MQCPRAIFFDLDDTLAESFHAPSPQALAGVGKLLAYVPVSIISGATFLRMHEQFLSTLESHPHIDRLYIFPSSSSQAYGYSDGIWRSFYRMVFTEAERERIKETILRSVKDIGVLTDIPHFGEQLIDRESQIAYTHVGIDASLETKASWDIDGSKRRALWETLKRQLPEFEILMGGTTTIDITLKNINKSHGVEWLSKELAIPVQEMLYVGDALYPGGNDAVVIPTGIQTLSVSGPAETEKIIDELLQACNV